MNKTAKHIIFKGRVQGVGFRYTTHRAASRYDLTGFVRNLPDGTVETLLQGTEPNIQACLDDLQDTFGGYFREINTTDQPVNPQYHDFRITY
ncbi:MAG: acylphosphatase [Planctomycetota bacterium]|jgi:acylphosphatase